MQVKDQSLFDANVDPIHPQNHPAIDIDTVTIEQNAQQPQQNNNNTQLTNPTPANTVTQDTLAKQPQISEKK
eukprot:4114668-Ditylum_brightwellii.AAC.1